MYTIRRRLVCCQSSCPCSVGVSGEPYGNIADMTNKGVELELGYSKKVGAVNFSVKGNVSYLKNEVTSLG